ncbi:tRNA:m(4)X modification enzyme TRM13 homolog isoform X1 [Conger conger]|uniref:tRNA:m(4)X modification enzyme TRM13 homolog isoform X1 n=1 Tax=Conger conger TaxID=82655 RepID=UPI002A59B989|nr:tRNA:m(4)X modification enzyme TRM13 homolog isoform X1 [Conger conger]
MAEVSGDGVSAPLPGRCGFYVERKRRYCKMVVASGKTFCGEHANAGQEDDRKRIPCPLDPKHTVFEDSLAKHLKKCNSREKPHPVYYVQNINAGPEDDVPADEVPLADRAKEELDLLVKKLKKAVEGLNREHEERILSHPALCEALNDPKNGDVAFKHLKQQASLLGHMKVLGLLSANKCYVEFGAGKGKLSHWINVALRGSDNVNFLLVERSTTRFKVDGKNRSTDSANVFERLQVDIQHLSLGKVPLLCEKGLPVIGVGKHLCGAATDLALRCMLGDPGGDQGEQNEQPPRKRLKQEQWSEGLGADAEPAPGAVGANAQADVPVSGLAIALCCHHRCDWRHYVGKDFFRERGLGAPEFTVLQRMSSWATCGLRKAADRSDGALPPGGGSERCEEEDHEHADDTVPSSLDGVVSAEDREHVGRLCKLLIDHGRVDFLRRKGFCSSLQYYTSRDVSLENVLLTAVPTG